MNIDVDTYLPLYSSRRERDISTLPILASIPEKSSDGKSIHDLYIEKCKERQDSIIGEAIEKEIPVWCLYLQESAKHEEFRRYFAKQH